MYKKIVSLVLTLIAVEKIVLAETESPPVTHGYSAVYIEETREIVVFGNFPHTWAYDIEKKTWRIIKTKNTPTRSEHSAVYDSVNKQIIIFGGDANGVLSDTWVFDIKEKEWKEMNTKKAPPARHSHSAIYDSKNRRMIIFGGTDKSRRFFDTWALDIEKREWEKIKTEEAPPMRSRHSAVYDSKNEQMIIFGGDISQTSSILPWAFDIKGETWKEIETEDVPLPRSGHSAVYDSVNNQMIIFSADNKRAESETWIFDIKGKTWEQIVTEKLPPPMFFYTAIYDESNDQMLVFGVSNKKVKENNLFSDIWAFDIESLQDNSAKASLKKEWKVVK